MDQIIKEELYRSIGVFPFVLVLTNLIIRNFLDELTLFLVFWLPIILTLVIALCFILIRKKSFYGSLTITFVISLAILNFGLIRGDYISMLVGLVIGIYGFLQVKKMKSKC